MPSINTSAYSQVWTRFPEEAHSNLTRKSEEQLENNVPLNWRWRNRSIKLFDGTTILIPDTKENQVIYPQQTYQKPT